MVEVGLEDSMIIIPSWFLEWHSKLAGFTGNELVVVGAFRGVLEYSRLF